MSSMDPEEFRELLDQHYEWPAEYMFKFIVKAEKEDVIKKMQVIFDALELIEVSTRSSHGGKYTAYTVRATMNSSSEVLDVYEKVHKLDGIIAL